MSKPKIVVVGDEIGEGVPTSISAKSAIMKIDSKKELFRLRGNRVILWLGFWAWPLAMSEKSRYLTKASLRHITANDEASSLSGDFIIAHHSPAWVSYITQIRDQDKK